MEAVTQAQPSYSDVVSKLNRASVAKHFDAYTDVAWDDETLQIDPLDPRWEQTPADPLGATAWYQSQSQAQRARIGLAWYAYAMRRGMEFENVLSRGLLEFALTRPDRSPDFRYAYHELIEEGQHSLMFQEFVNRSGCSVPPLAGFNRFLANRVPSLARRFPELFFVHVLAGEVPIDQTQRTLLRRGDAMHPLLRRIVQIHVTEEARHVCFAHKYLATHVPQLSLARRSQLQWLAPFVTIETARLMLAPQRSFTRRLGIPRHVMVEAHASELQRERMDTALRPLYDTFSQIGLVSQATAPIWRLLGYGPAQTQRLALPSANKPMLPE